VQKEEITPQQQLQENRETATKANTAKGGDPPKKKKPANPVSLSSKDFS